MSSFNSQDLFGSGPHQIIVGGMLIAKKRTGYAGSNGLESLTMGGRGYPVTIRGQLAASTRSDMNVLISAIETACLTWGPCTLVDANSCSYTYVELDGIELTGPTLYTALGVIQQYLVRGHKLYT